MKIAKSNAIPAQTLQHTLHSAMQHVENNADYPAEVKSATKVIVSSIQQNFKPIYPTGLYGATTEMVKSSIVQTLKEIKNDIAEQPMLAALKGLSIGLQITGVGKAFSKGELGVGEIRDITNMSGLSSVSNALPNIAPTDIIGIANLIVEKAIELLEKPENLHG